MIDAKACFVADDGGLGMALYEWRPEFSNSNEVGTVSKMMMHVLTKVMQLTMWGRSFHGTPSLQK